MNGRAETQRKQVQMILFQPLDQARPEARIALEFSITCTFLYRLLVSPNRKIETDKLCRC